MISLQNRLVLLKSLRFLVYAVVGEVRVKVLFGTLRCAIVWLRREPSQPFVVDVDPQWLNARKQDVNPQIEFVIVDEQGVANVLAHHRPFQFVIVGISCLLNLAQILYKVDTFPLGAL